MRSISPLRYPGGKTKVYNRVVELLKKNNRLNTTYIEPFAGGCGLGLLLLKNKIVDCLILNDIDKSIYSFWKAVLKYNDELCELIKDSEISLEERKKQKKIQDNKNKTDLRRKKDVLSLGFSTFFLNRVNRSGIIKAGVIGGKEQSGDYKMDCRFNKKQLIKQIEEIKSYKEKIIFFNLDAIKFIKKVKGIENSFIFFDPPYYEKGKELYINFYEHEDHKKLANNIFDLKNDWIVTYDNVIPIREMYSDYQQDEFEISYTLQEKKRAKEIMIFSNNLKNI